MNALLTIGLFVLVVAGLRWLNQRTAARKSAGLDALAAQLGLSTTRIDGLGMPMPSDSSTEAVTVAERRLAHAATAVWGVRKELRGQWNGRSISIGVLPARRYRIAIAAQCQLPGAIGLWAHRVQTSMGAPPEKSAAVSSGDATLDAAVRFAARDTAAAERLLSHPPIRAAMTELASLDDGVILGDWVCVVPYDDVLQDVATVRRLLDRIAAVASSIDRALAASRPG
jgi:hypothetical protein